jgi:hypothetical protein
LSAKGIEGLQVLTEDNIQVPATEARWVTVRLQMPYEAAAPGTHEIHFNIQSTDAQGQEIGHLSEKSMFLVPR